MIKLSEIIRTDCYIDCGSNDKLREVYPLIDLPEYRVQELGGITDLDTLILVMRTIELKGTTGSEIAGIGYPIHHISQIDLNG
jgi:hypothetical protein